MGERTRSWSWAADPWAPAPHMLWRAAARPSTLLERSSRSARRRAARTPTADCSCPSDVEPLAVAGRARQGSPLDASTAPAPSTSRRGRARTWCAGCGCSAPPRRRRGHSAAAPVLRALHVASAASTTSWRATTASAGCSTTTASSRSTRSPRRWRRPRRRPRSPRHRRARRRALPRARCAGAFPGMRGAVAGAHLLPGGRPPRPDAVHARDRRARGGRRRRRAHAAPRRIALEPDAGRRARRHDARRHRRRPGRARRRRLDAVPHARARPAPADRAGQGLQRRRRRGRRTSPSCRCTWATRTACSRRSATRLRLGSTLGARRLGHDGPPQARRAAARTPASASWACLPTARCGRSGAGRGRSRPTACPSSAACRAASASSSPPGTACSGCRSARSPASS